MKAKAPATGIICVARITARPEKRKELFMTITSLLELIKGEQGCRSYQFYGDASEEDSFMLIGEWEAETDWERHMVSENFAILLGSLELLSNEKRLDFKLLSPLDAFSPLPAIGATQSIGG